MGAPSRSRGAVTPLEAAKSAPADGWTPSVYFVGGGQSDVAGVTPATVGGKAYGLMRMDRAGLAVPPAFVLGTDLCQAYRAAGGRLPRDLAEVLGAHVRHLENATGRIFGGSRRPLLLSVRSGAPVSMPGMLDTVLNVGLNDRTVHGLIRATGNPRLAWDSYWRLIRAYATVVRRLPAQPFDEPVQARLSDELCPNPRDLDAVALRALVRESLDTFEELEERAFPQEPMQQLLEAIEAVLGSWCSERAVEYRRLNDIDDSIGTAVTAQVMVFGNAGSSSGSGVAFTRNPATGDDELYMDFVPDAQGEDVVSGRATAIDTELFPGWLPEVHAALERSRHLLETEFKDLQDFEFTVEEGRLYLLQTRPGKRTPWAALRIAVDLVEGGLIDPALALERLAGYDLESLERRRLRPGAGEAPLATATPASIGVATGAIAFDNDTAASFAEAGRRVILVRDAISTEDIRGLALADGILTARGSRTAHAAVVAREMAKVCLVGCGALRIDSSRRRCAIGERLFSEGGHLSLDGESGRIFAGRLTVERERPLESLAAVERWRRAGAGE